MPQTEKKFDLNQLFDAKALAMAFLIFVAGYFWTQAEAHRQQWQQIVVQNNERLNERTTWMRVTDIRLTRIEQQLGIQPLEKFELKHD